MKRKDQKDGRTWVSLTKSANVSEVDVLRGYLESKGVSVRLVQVGLTRVYPFTVGPLAQKMEILVPEEEEDKAREILEALASEEKMPALEPEEEYNPEAEQEGICLLVEEMRDEIIAFLQDLVKTESVNPPGHTRRIVRLICDKLDTFGGEYEMISEDDSRQNLVAWINRGKKPCLLYNSHMDTVPEGDVQKWTYGPFSGEVAAGYLYGRGAADAKASLAAMVMAAKVLAVSGLEMEGSLMVNPVCDEETGGEKGTRYLLETGAVDPDHVVIGEITGNAVAVAEKGVINIDLKVLGRSAHASTPWDGANAIDGMTAVLDRLKKYFHEHLEEKTHALTPPPSMNTGMIKGGVKSNMVAEQCEAVVDMRPIPGMDTDQLSDDLQKVLDEYQEQQGDLTLESSIRVLGRPFETDPEEKMVNKCREAVRFLDSDDEITGYAQVSDGRFFAEKGIPTVILGPGEPAQAHTHDEHISVEEVIKAVKIYVLTALKMLRYHKEEGKDQAD